MLPRQGFRGPIQFRIILYNSNIKICKFLDLLHVSPMSKSRPYTSPIADPILIFLVLSEIPFPKK